MTLLKNIRKYSLLLIIIIGLSITSFFIDPKVFLNFKKNPNIIGKINNEKISRKEYIEKIEFYKQFFQNIKESYFPFQVWNIILMEKILNQQAKKIGLRINDKNFWEAIEKESIYKGIEQFQDKNKIFSQKKFKNYISNLEKNSKNNPQIEKEYKLWLFEKKNIPNQLIANQYIKMIFSVLNTVKFQSKSIDKIKNLSSKIDYIFIPYKKYELENHISIKEKEIKKYIQSYKKNYKISNSRDLISVIFPRNLSKEDIKESDKQIKSLIKELKTTNENEKFILKNSELPYNSEYYSIENIPSFLKNFVNNSKIGEVYGPIKESNYFIVIKLVNKKMVFESANISHILISYKGAANSKVDRSKKEAKKLAENLLKNIKINFKNFKNFLKKSDDSLVKYNKGNLNWNKKNSISEFENYITKNPKGSIGIVETSFGYHIIKINNKSNLKPNYQLAILKKTIKPSKKTENILYNRINKFIQKTSKCDNNDFIKKVRDLNYQIIFSKEILPSQYYIEELKTNCDPKIIHWSFEKNRKKGDMKIFTTPFDDYIIVRVSNIQKKGLIPLDKIKKEVISILKKKKLSLILSKKIKKTNTNNIKKLSNFLKEKIKENIYVQFSNPIIKGIGSEPKVIGTSMGIKINKISLPIEGEKGLFIIRVLKREIENKKTNKLYKQINNIEDINPMIIFEALKNKSKIKDYINEELIEKIN